MIPTSSSSDTNGCNNISSNCVIWQGPDISCINLCNGDTVSEVVAKLATKLCDIEAGVSGEPDLTGFNLKCALPNGATPSTLVENLQALVNYVCSLPTDSGSDYTEPNINLCAALQTSAGTDSTGNQITQLPLSEYALLVGNEVCSIVATITTIQTQITSLGDRVTALEANFPLPAAQTLQIIPGCVTATAGQLTDIDVVLAALETEFCALQTAVGLPSIINQAVAQQAIANDNTLLSAPTTSYSAQAGWNTSPANMANSLQNAWVVIKDLYDAVKTIQVNCCPSGCEELVLTYTVQRIQDSLGVTSSVVLNLAGSAIPAGFNDVNGTNTVTVTDGLGASITDQVNFTQAVATSSYPNIDVSQLSSQTELTVTTSASFTDNAGTTCNISASANTAADIPCPSDIKATNVTETGFDVEFTNVLGTAAQYSISIYPVDSSTNVVGSTAVANSGVLSPTQVNMSHTFTGLTPISIFAIRLTVTFAGVTKDCPDVQVTTLALEEECDGGIDVAFVLDYTFSMKSVIDQLQNSIDTLTTAIETQSNHPTNSYRLALVTYDEEANATPNYASDSRYSSLPLARRRVVPTGVFKAGGVELRLFQTAWVQFANNNKADFKEKLEDLCGSTTSGCGTNAITGNARLPIGDGANFEEAGVPAMEQVVGAGAFAGAFRTNVAKFMILITDDREGGADDTANAQDIAQVNQLSVICQAAGIKVICVGAGVNKSIIDLQQVPRFPYQELATNTGGTFNASADVSNIVSAIENACGNPPSL